SAFEGEAKERAALPIGVFDSGIGGLTVFEALLTADNFDNKTLKPGPDGKPDFEDERFIYLGDQANMPYGNYSKEGKTDYLRELILKDATFLLGTRHRSAVDAEPRFDKPPVKAIVIACNTATAFGLDDLRAAMERWNLPVPVIGVVEAGARGLLGGEQDRENAIGVLATVGTCASEVYPKTIQSTLGRGGHGPAIITQHGSANLAAIIEGEPGFATPMDEQIENDVRALVEAHRESRDGQSPIPLGTVMLGCTHFPLVLGEIESAFASLKTDPELGPWIADSRTYIDPAAWTARQLFQELARNQVRAQAAQQPATKHDAFYLSVPNSNSEDAVLSPEGGLDHAYKYAREIGKFGVEDTVVVPMTRAALTDSGRRLVRDNLPETWGRLPAGEPEDLDGPPLVTAEAWAIADGETGELLWEHRAHQPRKTASITKTMAALVVLSLTEKDPAVLDEVITFSEAADKTRGSTSSVKAGEKVTVREGLYGLLLPSGNDMGNAFAEHFSPRLDPPTEAMLAAGLDNPVQAKRANFIAEMNRHARKFGMEDTFYRIAYGDGGTPAQMTSTAADLCRLGFHAMSNPQLREIVGTQRHVGKVTKADGSIREQPWENTNELLSLDRGYDGIKTGSTASAGRCLLVSGQRDDRRLIVAVLGSDSSQARNADARNLFRWAWRNSEKLQH
ncbi:MAG: aspartate/glutamate racemase family protein, partial [Verrucomicrobiae bacterium]|nr:aspartate/glutamate racemase family protein [Verrucomicrobiae bacterium]